MNNLSLQGRSPWQSQTFLGKFNFPIIVLLIIVSLTLSFSQNPSSQLVSANNDFGFQLFSELIRQHDIKNMMVSPTSIAMALAMTYNGADRTTKEAMAKTLGVSDLDLKEFNQSNLDLKKSLTKTDKKITLSIANSLWADKRIQFKKEFVNANKKYYSAQVSTLDFASPKSVNTINQWVSKSTKGKIPKIIDQIGEDVIAYLINAIYFKADWQKAFDKKLTSPKIFYCLDGTKKEHPMMHQENRFPYFETDKFQAIGLPYRNNAMSMYIFLPREKSSTPEFLKQLNYENWQKWLPQFRLTNGDITLPKFKLEFGKSLKDILKAMGMEIAFDDTLANFTKMASSQLNGNIYIGDVIHKTFIEVAEQGTEAAAVTAVQMEIKAIAMDQFSMTIDRPFFYAITDNTTNSILFMGIVTEPK